MIRREGSRTYNCFLQVGCSVEEFEEGRHERQELRVRVRVLHAERDLRIGFDQGGPQLFQVLERVGIVLELGVLDSDNGRLLQQCQVLYEVERAEARRGVA